MEDQSLILMSGFIFLGALMTVLVTSNHMEKSSILVPITTTDGRQINARINVTGIEGPTPSLTNDIEEAKEWLKKQLHLPISPSESEES